MVDKNHDNWALLESFGKYITVICKKEKIFILAFIFKFYVGRKG